MKPTLFFAILFFLICSFGYAQELSPLTFIERLNTSPVDRLELYSDWTSVLEKEVVKSDSLQTDKALWALLNFKTYLCNNFNVKLWERSDYEDLNSLVITSIPASPKAIAFEEYVKSKGFTIASSEGSIYVQIDPVKVSTRFRRFLSREFKRLLDELSIEIREPETEDASILVSKNELLRRALSWEHFIKNYPGETAKEHAKSSHSWLMYLLMNGSENSLNYDFATKLYLDDHLEFFREIGLNYPSTDTGKRIISFMKLLAKNEYRRTKEIEVFLKKLMN